MASGSNQGARGERGATHPGNDRITLARERRRGIPGAQARGDRARRRPAAAARGGKLIDETLADTKAQATGFVTPLKARYEQRIAHAGAAVQSTVGSVLGRFGIPTKADIDELSRHLATLSRQLKTAK